jgi:flagellar biosynthetic protein FliP
MLCGMTTHSLPSADPRTAHPRAADPRTADLHHSGLHTADPRTATAEPRTADPRAADPGTDDPLHGEVHPAPHSRSHRIRHFVRHYLEMVVAMLAGMMVLGPVEDLVWPTLTARADVGVMVMATNMAIGMGAWMRFRGHSSRGIAEMSASMYVPFLVLLVPFWTGGIGEHALMTWVTS